MHWVTIWYKHTRVRVWLWLCMWRVSLCLPHLVEVSTLSMLIVCVSLTINVCMFTASNTLLMSTAMVRVGGMGWLKPVATVLLMLCSAVFVEC